MTLSILANEENWQAFDDAWTSLIASGGEIDELCRAIEVIGSKRRISRCLPTLKIHAESLAEKGRPAEAATIVGATVRAGGPIGELAEQLLTYSEAAWGKEEWWNAFLEISGLKRESLDLRKAWIYFDDMRSYKVGTVVFHAAGWGVGEVKEVNYGAMEALVHFSGPGSKKDRFPLRTAVEIFERLPATDLRAQRLIDPQGLDKRLKEQPLEILKAVLQRYGGKASNITIRNALAQIGVDGTKWSNWWKKTRLLAENDTMYRVSGNIAKCEIELLRRALDPVEALRRQLVQAKSLKDALARVRDLLGGEKLQPEIRGAALDVIEQLASETSAPIDQRLSAWMLLREHPRAPGGKAETPAALLDRLKALAAKPAPADSRVAPPLWAEFARMPGAREQERSVTLLVEIFGEGWVEIAVANLNHASPGMARPLIDELRRHKRDAELAQWYTRLLARPRVSPFVLTELARLVESGKLTGEFPTPVQRAMALIELSVYLQEERVGDSVMARAQQRLTDLLLEGEPPLVQTMILEADIPALRSIRAMLLRGVGDRIDLVVTDIVLDMGGDVFRSEALPFWMEDKIWTTRAGLQKRESELNELKEKKIPANAEAIAKAASYGDLSENAEWEQAIEEQRQLTNAASEMDKELRMAALIENASIPEDTVCPGTIVTFRDRRTGDEHVVTILGPWDAKDDHTISYKAPLASGMLGKSTGKNAIIELPSGTQDVEILKIDMAKLA